MAGCHKPLWQEPKKSSQISDPFCFSPMMIIMIRLISPISKLIKMLLLIVVKNGKKPIFFPICFSIYFPHFFDIPFLFRHKIDFPITTFFWFSSFRKQFSSLFTNIKHAPKIPFSVPHIVCPFMVWSSLLGGIHKLCSSFFSGFWPPLPPSSLTWTFWRPPIKTTWTFA